MKLPVILSLAAATLAVSGCATSKTAPETDADGKKVEYVKYTPVGSHIPVKVRKDQLPDSERQAASDRETLQRAQRSQTPRSAGGSQ